MNESIKKNEGIKLKPKNYTKFSNFLIQLLKNNEIGLVAKALKLSLEYEKVYCESKIYTDIRPVFSNPELTEKDIPRFITSHSIKISYHKDEQHQDIFIAGLNTKDLKELKEQIIRAEEKEEKIKVLFKEKGIEQANFR